MHFYFFALHKAVSFEPLLSLEGSQGAVVELGKFRVSREGVVSVPSAGLEADIAALLASSSPSPAPSSKSASSAADE